MLVKFLINIQTVMGPTPPGTGVIIDAFLLTKSKLTSPTILLFSARLIPTSMTMAPYLTSVTKFLDPAALITMSAFKICS